MPPQFITLFSFFTPYSATIIHPVENSYRPCGKPQSKIVL